MSDKAKRLKEVMRNRCHTWKGEKPQQRNPKGKTVTDTRATKANVGPSAGGIPSRVTAKGEVGSREPRPPRVEVQVGLGTRHSNQWQPS